IALGPQCSEASGRLGRLGILPSLITIAPNRKQVEELLRREVRKPKPLELAKRDLLVIGDVLRVLAQLIGDRVHLGEEIGRWRLREVAENRMVKTVIVISHVRVSRSTNAQQPDVIGTGRCATNATLKFEK